MSDIMAMIYLIASVLFILALRGLSHPSTARKGNMYGIVGMALVIFATLFGPDVMTWSMILAGIVLGGGIGLMFAKRAKMTELPELVALFNGFGGLASVFIALATYANPELHAIGTVGNIAPKSLVEIALSIVIGGVTFSGSLIAFGKLSGKIRGRFLVFPKHVFLNLSLLTAFVRVGRFLKW